MKMIRHQGEVYVEAEKPYVKPAPHKKCTKGLVWSYKQKKCIKLTPEQVEKRKQYLKRHPRKK